MGIDMRFSPRSYIIKSLPLFHYHHLLPPTNRPLESLFPNSTNMLLKINQQNNNKSTLILNQEGFKGTLKNLFHNKYAI